MSPQEREYRRIGEKFSVTFVNNRDDTGDDVGAAAAATAAAAAAGGDDQADCLESMLMAPYSCC